MTKALTKVVYKLDNLSTREYMVIVNPEEVGSFVLDFCRLRSPAFIVVQYNKWKEGGKPATSDCF